MPLPILAVAAATAGGLAIARLLDAALGSDPPPDEGAPDVYGPGQAPDAPWVADRERHARGSDVYVDCLPGGRPGMDANAVFARWLNHEKGIPIPGNYPNLSRKKLAAKLAVASLAGLTKDYARAVALYAEWDSIGIGCMGREGWEQFKRAPEKIGDWVQNRIGDGSGGVSIGNEDNGIEVSDSGGSISVGGKTIASW